MLWVACVRQPSVQAAVRNDAEGLAQLDRLRSPLCAEFVEQPARMSFHRIFAHAESLGDFAVAETGGDQAQDFQFARRNAQFDNPCLVKDERACERDFCHDHIRHLARKRQPQPDPDARKKRREEDGVDRDGVFDDQETVLGEFQDGEQDAAGYAEEDDLAHRALTGVGDSVRTSHGGP
jgi:hypothetical protein